MKSILTIAAALIAAPCLAQTAAPATTTSEAVATIDPARLAEARIALIKLLPPGVYRTIMNGTMSAMFDHLGDTMSALPMRQLAEASGVDPKEAAALDKMDLRRVMAIYDPHWEERQKLTMHAMFDQMGAFFTTLEPELREAYARAYARRFTLAELQDINRFFATPSGTRYAANYITIATDPAVTGEMQAMMPKMMKQMPVFLAAAQKATASLPPARTIGQLTPAERADLAKALGVPPAQLHDPAKPAS